MGIFERIKSWFSAAPRERAEPALVLQKPSAPAASNEDSDDHRKPLILISGASADSKSVAAMTQQIRDAGAKPVFIGNHEQRIEGGVQQAVEQDLAKADALIVMGNNSDIDPKKYGQVAGKTTQVESPGRAAYEEAAIQTALSRKIPLLGICGGMQRINVLGGGTLHQDVPSLVGDNHHMQSASHLAPVVPVQLVKIDKDSKLGEIAGKNSNLFTPQHGPLLPGVIMENSFHHQAVAKPREDFRVCARSDDGIIEAIEPKADSPYAKQFVMGVQWHPEFGASDFGPKLAARITEEAIGHRLLRENTPTLMGQPITPGELAARFAPRQGGFAARG